METWWVSCSLQSRFPQEEVSRSLVFHHEEMRVYAERGAICSRTDGRERLGKKRSREREEENVLAYVSPDFCPMPVLIPYRRRFARRRIRSN